MCDATIFCQNGYFTTVAAVVAASRSSFLPVHTRSTRRCLVVCLTIRSYIHCLRYSSFFTFMHGNGIKRSFILSKEYFGISHTHTHNTAHLFMVLPHASIFMSLSSNSSLCTRMCARLCFRIFSKFICINLRANGIHTFLPKF